MRELDTALICQTVADMVVQANCCIGADVMESLRQGRDREEKPLARSILDKLIRNDEIAARRAMPLCQDTGMAFLFVEYGDKVVIENGSFEEAVQEGVRQAYRDGYLRKSVVSDPVIDRVNTGDNTPAIIYTDIVPGSQIKFLVSGKGFGSENMSAIKMLTPSAGLEGVKRFILDTVDRAGPNPCPPIVVGIGIGGSFEKAAQLAKKAAMLPITEKNPDPRYAALEDELLEKINALGYGPAGLGGASTALGVNILTFPTHIAGMPVAVNICCHVARHKSAVL